MPRLSLMYGTFMVPHQISNSPAATGSTVLKICEKKQLRYRDILIYGMIMSLRLRRLNSGLKKRDFSLSSVILEMILISFAIRSSERWTNIIF